MRETYTHSANLTQSKIYLAKPLREWLNLEEGCGLTLQATTDFRGKMVIVRKQLPQNRRAREDDDG